jgi:hypothetical protein
LHNRFFARCYAAFAERNAPDRSQRLLGHQVVTLLVDDFQHIDQRRRLINRQQAHWFGIIQGRREHHAAGYR